MCSSQAHAALLHSLTSLTCSGLRTPVQTPELDELFYGLPALQECDLRVNRAPDSIPLQQLALHVPTFPQQLLHATRLTSLKLRFDETLGPLYWSSLPARLEALTQLRTLRLQNCLSARLTEHISALSSLTELGILQEALDAPDEGGAQLLLPLPLPSTVTALAALRTLDVSVQSLAVVVTLLTKLSGGCQEL